MSKNARTHKPNGKVQKPSVPVSPMDPIAEESEKDDLDHAMEEVLSPFWAWRALGR